MEHSLTLLDINNGDKGMDSLELFKAIIALPQWGVELKKQDISGLLNQFGVDQSQAPSTQAPSIERDPTTDPQIEEALYGEPPLELLPTEEQQPDPTQVDSVPSTETVADLMELD